MKIYPTTNTNFCGVKYLSIPPKITENLGSIEELANTSSLDLVVRHVPAQIPRPKFQMYTMDVTFLPKKTAKKGSSHSSFFIIREGVELDNMIKIIKSEIEHFVQILTRKK